jgi:hypothetical protein
MRRPRILAAISLPLGMDGTQILAADDERHVLAGDGKPCAHVAADRPGADDSYFHESP